MKTFATLLLFLFSLLTIQSCSDDDNDTNVPKREIAVKTTNATITQIVIKVDDKTVFISSNLNKEYYHYIANQPKKIEVEVTAIVNNDNETASLEYGDVIGGDVFSSLKEAKLENATKGNELNLSGEIEYTYD